MAADSPKPTETIHAADIKAGLLANPASEPGIAPGPRTAPGTGSAGFRLRRQWLRLLPAMAPGYCRQYAGAQSGYRVTIVPL